MPRGIKGSGTTTPTARSGTSATTARSGTRVAALGYRGTAAAHNWWALPIGNRFDYLTAQGNEFVQVKTMEQMATIVGDILQGKFAPISVALANRSVPLTKANAIPKVSTNGTGSVARKRVRNRVSGSRVAPVTAGT